MTRALFLSIEEMDEAERLAYMVTRIASYMNGNLNEGLAYPLVLRTLLEGIDEASVDELAHDLLELTHSGAIRAN